MFSLYDGVKMSSERKNRSGTFCSRRRSTFIQTRITVSSIYRSADNQLIRWFCRQNSLAVRQYSTTTQSSGLIRGFKFTRRRHRRTKHVDPDRRNELALLRLMLLTLASRSSSSLPLILSFLHPPPLLLSVISSHVDQQTGLVAG